ncbi:hypothetical protein LIER_25590 [Lithospermum erythrorhizon]|uniref:Uncharacterized protein n=1 Tax=Lithospermum erythrorhizon TaxID=34254 RepID=A0AAV3R6S5_LITER
MNMGYDGKRTLWSFIDGERESLQSSPHRLSVKSDRQISTSDPDNLLYSPSRSSTGNYPMYPSFLPPPSPDSPWTLSPLQTPSPSLLYHCIASLHRQEGTIYSIAVSKGLVFTGSESSRIRAWRQPDCVERGHVKASCGHVSSILAHGNMLFTSHKDHKVRVWNLFLSENFKAKKIANLPRTSTFLFFPKTCTYQHKERISCMAYYHAEGLLYTGSFDKTVKAWRVLDHRCVDSFLAHEDNINSVVVNQEDGCVFTGSSDGCVKIWRRVYGQSSHTLTMTLKFQMSPVNALALSSSCFLYSGSSDGFINFWEKEKLSYRFNHGGFLQGHRFGVLCLDAIEKLIFSGSEDTTIRIWRREEGSCFHECLAVLDAHRGPVKCLAASLEIGKVVMGFLLYSAGLDQTFKVWRVKVLPDQIIVPLEALNVQRNDNDDEDDNDDIINNNIVISNNNMKAMDYETTPVLSPSWVEKKLQADHPFH